MFAILAAIGFAIALILHLLGGSALAHVTDFELAGLLCLALHFVFETGIPAVIRRTAP